ncbi:MAG: RNA polymerase sigma factor [Bacteroidales bacterium]
MEKCKKGEQKSLRLLYDSYAPLAMGVAMRYTGCEEKAKDVLHDSFVKILLSIERFEYRGSGSLKAWICRLVANTALSSLRKNMDFSTQKNEELEHIGEEQEEELSVYESANSHEIIKSVGRLPVRLRAVFNLYMFEDQSHAEIAQSLQISEATSRVRLHRAKEQVAADLKEKFKEVSNER